MCASVSAKTMRMLRQHQDPAIRDLAARVDSRWRETIELFNEAGFDLTYDGSVHTDKAIARQLEQAAAQMIPVEQVIEVVPEREPVRVR